MDEFMIAEIKKNARNIHAEGKFLREWGEDVDLFVKDMVELVTTSYEAGFEDAIDQGLDALRELI